jgi:hypothetical protein
MPRKRLLASPKGKGRVSLPTLDLLAVTYPINYQSATKET